MAAITLFSSKACTFTYERNALDWAHKIALSTSDGRCEGMLVTTKGVDGGEANQGARKITAILEDLAQKIEVAEAQGTTLSSEETASGIHAIIQSLIKNKGYTSLDIANRMSSIICENKEVATAALTSLNEAEAFWETRNHVQRDGDNGARDKQCRSEILQFIRKLIEAIKQFLSGNTSSLSAAETTLPLSLSMPSASSATESLNLGVSSVSGGSFKTDATID